MTKTINAPAKPGPDQFFAGVRQVLLMIGGGAVSKGYVTQSELEVLVGAIVIIGTFIYGQWKTRQRAQQVGDLADHVPDTIARKV